MLPEPPTQATMNPWTRAQIRHRKRSRPPSLLRRQSRSLFRRQFRPAAPGPSGRGAGRPGGARPRHCALCPGGRAAAQAAGSTASFEDRLAMTRLAIAGEPGFAVSLADAPKPSGAPNYTLETLLAPARGAAAGEHALLPDGRRLVCRSQALASRRRDSLCSAVDRRLAARPAARTT